MMKMLQFREGKIKVDVASFYVNRYKFSSIFKFKILRKQQLSSNSVFPLTTPNYSVVSHSFLESPPKPHQNANAKL